jgi:hypothetical protein
MAIEQINREDGTRNINNQDASIPSESRGGGSGGGGAQPAPPVVPIKQPTNPIYENQSLFVNIAIASTPNDSTIVVDGNEINRLAPSTITYSEKELLTPKVISVKKSGVQSGDVYRVYTVYKELRKDVEETIGFDDDIREFNYRQDPERPGAVIRERVERPKVYTNVTYFPYYELIVEKLINNQYVEQSKIESKSGGRQATLNTSLTFDIKSEPTYTEPIPTAKGKITINGDVYQNDLIEYRTTDGNVGLVTNGTTELDFSPNSSGGNNIRFISKGLNSQTHSVTYKVNKNGVVTNNQLLDYTLDLVNDNVIVDIIVTKNNNQPVPLPDAPTIRTEGITFEFNIAGNDTLSIPYNSYNTDEVVFSLGTTQRVISNSGSIVLSKTDFFNGVGAYVLYLQPRSNRAGSGETIKVTINVVNKFYLPGPDITNIYYPQNIKGADFKEFEVDFDVSWQSINTNYIEIYVSKYDKEYALGRFSPAGLATFKVSDVLRKSKLEFNEDTDKIQFEFLLIPFNIEGDEVTEGKIERISMLFDKGDLKLQRGNVVADIRTAFEQSWDETILNEEVSKFLSHYIHLGDGDNKLIATWGIDKETFSTYTEDNQTGTRRKVKEEKALVLKLYEPLPREINPNQQLWISKIQSIPIIEQVTIIDELQSECIRLRPNFNVSVSDDIGYQILDDLIASGSTTSTDLVSTFVSSSGFSLENLNIEYESGSQIKWENFVKYSSAEERIRNFYYKVELIEAYNTKINFVSASTSFINGGVAAGNEIKSYESQIQNLKNGFDGFEKYLFTSSSNGLTYPFEDSVTYYNPTSSQAISWFNGTISETETYDYNNKNLLTNNTPAHIVDDANNEEFVLFLNMIGQHFDILWTHVRGISQSKKLEHKYEDGIGNEMIYHMLESLGWDADMGVQSQFLWEYAFGKDSDGTTSSTMSGKSRQHQIWRRLLNNLPYLLKHKGTKRALHAAMACYGVPASLLTIMEYGGPQDPSSDATTTFTFDDRTCSLAFDSASYLSVPFIEYNGYYPNAVEFRLNSDNNNLTQSLVSGDGWELNLVPGTGSLAKIEFSITASGVVTTTHTDYMPYFNDEYTNVVLNRRTGSTTEIYEVYFKEGFNGRIRNDVSSSISYNIGSTSWESSSILSVGKGVIGSIDEFRLWRTPLSESRIDNHTLLPDAIDGSHISASSVDLLFRLDFEYPKDLSQTGSINNVAIIGDYTSSAHAIDFNETIYPYNYVPYERSVTAKVPSSGLTYGNKFRFESQTLTGDLNYKTRATKKSYDQSAIDSDKLGLFFSPMKEINMDILRSLGEFNIDDYIGNPADEYSDSYSGLTQLRNYYFQRYNLNMHEYIQLVRYIDKSLFETLESLVPARAKVSSGLLIEPHILERSKVKWNKPTGSLNNLETIIDITESTLASATYENLKTTIVTNDSVLLSAENTNYNTEIDTRLLSTASAMFSTYDGEIDTTIETNTEATYNTINVQIDAQITGSIRGAYDGVEYVQIGLDKNSLSVAGFGLYGENGNTIRNYIDLWGNRIKERSKVYLIKESYTEKVPVNINSLDRSLGTELQSVTKYKHIVNILPFTGSNGNETQAPSIGGNIVEVSPLNGYFPSHYRNTGDLTTGLQNSYFNGSKQTAATNILGGSPVQTFTTNPNILRVSDTGRGSGEPILEVD